MRQRPRVPALGICPGFRALKWSLVANGASFGLGVVSSALFGWP